MKVWLIVAASVVAAGATAVYAVAGHGSGSVASYTGCLKLVNGTIKNVAEGASPSAACGNGELEIHLGGGDISAVSASDGLQGGGTSGNVALGIQPSFRLPQGCSADAVAKWNSGAWGCAADIDTNSGGDITGVTAVQGLTGGGTIGTVTVGLSPSYQLPQACASGQVAKASGVMWTCGTDSDTTYSGANFALSGQSCSSGFVRSITSTGTLGCGTPAGASISVTEVAGPQVTACSTLDPGCLSLAGSTANCPDGTTVVGGGYTTTGLDSNVFHERRSGNGWNVAIENHSAVSGATLTAFAMCLSLS